nr:hypothetical protein BaRGS_000610 [Batillaria attramentaria]
MDSVTSKTEQDDADPAKRKSGSRLSSSHHSHRSSPGSRPAAKTKTLPSVKRKPRRVTRAATEAPLGHKHVTIPMVERAICQLSERNGSAVSKIRTVLGDIKHDQVSPPACCVKKALMRGMRRQGPADKHQQTGTGI